MDATVLRSMEGNKAVVEVLLANETVDPDSKAIGKYYNGRTPLSWAAEKGHEAVVKVLLMNDRVNPNSTDDWRRTPQHHAAVNGHKAVAKLLESHGT